MGSFGGRGGGLTTGIGTIGDASSGSVGGIGSDMLRGGQDEPYAKPWHNLIPGNTGLNTPEIIKQVNYTAGRGRYARRRSQMSLTRKASGTRKPIQAAISARRKWVRRRSGKRAAGSEA